MSKSYPTNLTDGEWQPLKSYLPTPQKRGRPRIHSFREIMDAIFYLSKSGCRWRLCCPVTSHLGRPSTTTSDDGASSTVPGKGCTTRSASACAPRSDGLLDPVPQ